MKKKLQELAEKAKQDGSSGQESQSGSGSQGGQAGGSSERPPESGGVWRNSGSFDRVGRQDGDDGGLSDSERAGLEARMRAIEELGRTGQEYLRRDGTPSPGLDRPIFGDMRLLQDSRSAVEKDW